MLKTFFGRGSKPKAGLGENFAGIRQEEDVTDLAPTTESLRGATLDKGTMNEPLDALEEFLIVSDMGMEMATSVVDHLRCDISSGNITNMLAFVEELNTNLLALLELPDPQPQPQPQSRLDENHGNSTNQTGDELAPAHNDETPSVVMLVGVNGVGKTTSVSKLAHYHKNNLGKKVLIAAADTYRAAAVEQLQHWGDAVGVEVVSQQQGADSAAVMYDALSKSIATGVDILLCDTSGRLQNNDNLMRELEKSTRVLQKLSPHAPHHVLLVIDATLGSNSISQAQVFTDYISPTGIILTKTDAQLQPGSLFQIVRGLGLPIRYVSYGEGVDQLSPFQAYAFVGDFIAGFLQTYGDRSSSQG